MSTRRIQTDPYYRDGRGIIAGGLISGIIAGIIMAIVAMGYAAMTGMGMLTPLRLIAATLYGVNALIGGSSVLMAGLIIGPAIPAGGRSRIWFWNCLRHRRLGCGFQPQHLAYRLSRRQTGGSASGFHFQGARCRHGRGPS